MTTDKLRDEYKRNRAKYPTMGAGTALAWARSAVKRAEAQSGWDWAYSGETATREEDGFTLTLSVRLDEYPDSSHVGSFTDNWEPGAIVITPENRYAPAAFRCDYRYFVPGISYREHCESLSKSGWARHAADCEARRYGREDMRRAFNYCAYIVSVEVEREGIELGQSSIGGCEFDDSACGTDNQSEAETIADDYGLVSEALTEAREAIARLTSSVAKEA